MTRCACEVGKKFSSCNPILAFSRNLVQNLKEKTTSNKQVQQYPSCAGSISQAVGLAALEDVDETELQEKFQEMKLKRDYVLQRLSSIPHANVSVPPQGAFYVLPDVSHYTSNEFDDVEFCKTLLQEHQLALVPGSAFGALGTVRISYATSLEELKVAMDKLQTFLELLSKRSAMES
jgi:aspartate/methionine/tyrosine aminotransferase